MRSCLRKSESQVVQIRLEEPLHIHPVSFVVAGMEIPFARTMLLFHTEPVNFVLLVG